MKFLALISLLISTTTFGQLGNYQSLNLPFGARNAALGGRVVSLSDGDVMQFFLNPAVLDSVSAGDVGVNFSPLFAGIYAFNGAYCADMPMFGKLAFAVAYVDYGDFAEKAANGDPMGTFQVNDLVMSVGKSHRISSFSLGVNLKYVTNTIAGYGSSLVLGDLGGLYKSPKADFSVGIVFKNFGFVVQDFTGNVNNQVPFDVQISTSIKPEHMPFRFSISSYNLSNRDLYFEPEDTYSRSKSVEIADKIFRKVNIGAEMIIHESMQFLFGYSHLRRQELQVNSVGYGAGFSFGFALRVKTIRLRYSHATYHAAGGTDFFTVQTSLQSFKKELKVL